MSAKYLLPCSCGRKIPVETTQASQDIQCSCGKTLTIPTMQGIRRLEPYLEPVEQRVGAAPYKGVALGLALLGLVILAVAGTKMYQNYATRPVLIQMKYFNPWETWVLWHDILHQGVRFPEYSESPYITARRIYRRDMILWGILAGVGGAALAAGGIIAMRGRACGGSTT